MKKRIISAKTCIEFREYFVGCILREISNAFDAYEIRCDLDYQPPKITGERRILVEQYFHTVDWTDRKSTNQVLKVFGNEVSKLLTPSSEDPLEWLRSDNEKENLLKINHNKAQKLISFLKHDGFEWQDDKFIDSVSSSGLEDLSNITKLFDWQHLALQIQRMKESVDIDPSLAIGTSKELIETVCKTILEERGVIITNTPEIPFLTKTVLTELSLVPEGIEDEKRGSELIKAILRSLGTIGNNLAQLRSLYGTGHGKNAKSKALQSRHAKLAVGTSATFVTFLFETHQENQRKNK
jgi:hypothetical protein